LGSGKELPPQVATDVTTTPGMLSANNRTLEANSLYAALRDSTKFLEFELKDPTTALSNTFLKFL
jgi:hypothetical protein